MPVAYSKAMQRPGTTNYHPFYPTYSSSTQANKTEKVTREIFFKIIQPEFNFNQSFIKYSYNKESRTRKSWAQYY